MNAMEIPALNASFQRPWSELMACALRRIPLINRLCCIALIGWTLVGDSTRAQAQDEFVVLRQAAEQVAPSVVQIETTGGKERVGEIFIAAGPSTGVVVSADGHIITSAYAVVHEPSTILVRLADGRRIGAELLARDHARNLVLLHAPEAAGLPVPQAAPNDSWQVGAFTVAVGKVFDPAQVNTSVGILSAVDRVWGKAVQTDSKVSPNNYGGPLVDLQGRVIGIIAPLSPQSETELAGFEWYDSGIGFAVPLVDVLARLERLKQGQDLYDGKFGVTPKASDNFTSPVVIASVSRNGPAAAAGLLPDDVLVEVNGRPIRRFPDLKHALGPFYAGEEITGVAQRGEERIAFRATLSKEIEPFRIAALGILPPMLPVPDCEIGAVLPSSAAERAGLKPGDRIVAIGDQAVADWEQLATTLAAFVPGDQVQVQRSGSDGVTTVSVALDSLSAQMPPETLVLDREPSANRRAELRELKLEQFPESCDVVVASDHQADSSASLVVWLGTPGKPEVDRLQEIWGPVVSKHRIVVIAPHASDERSWAKADVERIGLTVQRAIQDYGVNPRRTVVMGRGAGTAMASLVFFDSTRPVRGMGILGGGLQQGVALPENEPLRRLLIATWLKTDVVDSNGVRGMLEAVNERGIPMSAIPSPDPDAAETLEEVARWAATLDRL